MSAEESMTIKDQAATLRLKGYSTSEVMRLLGCSKTTVKRANKDIKAGKYQADDDTRYIDRIDGTTRTIIINGITEAVRSEEDMLRFFGVDPNIWSIERQQLNSWGSVNNPNAQRKLKLIKNPSSGVYEDYMRAALDHSPKEHARYEYELKNSGRMMLIAAVDLHLGLLAWHAESGENYDLKIAEELYLAMISYYRNWAEKENVEKIMLTVGSDFYNSANQFNTTTKGTMLSEDDRWTKTFVRGRELIVNAVEQLRQVCPVEIVVVLGNHSIEREFALGDALYCYFHTCEDVTVDNTPAVYKFSRWGKTLIAQHHGHEAKAKSLPMVLAQDAPPVMWANTKYREWVIGHKHHQKTGYFETVVDQEGVKVRHIPSLVAASRWEHGMGFRSQRECVAMIYDKEFGHMLDIVFKPDMVESDKPSPNKNK